MKDQQFIYVATTGRKTGRPHEVELWFAYAPSNHNIYLSHEGEYTDWMKNIQKNPRLKVRIGDVAFDARGRFLDSKEAESETGKKALYEKYYNPASKVVIDDWFSLSTLVEIQPI